jgi:predicted nucleic acid-binding Zn ribbon protein
MKTPFSFFPKYECEKCGKKFRKVEQFMQHQQVAHETKQYICEKCGVGFDGMEQMRDHAKRLHSYNRILDDRKKEEGN